MKNQFDKFIRRRCFLVFVFLVVFVVLVVLVVLGAFVGSR